MRGDNASGRDEAILPFMCLADDGEKGLDFALSAAKNTALKTLPMITIWQRNIEEISPDRHADD
jgi:hypothetical protein